MTQEQKTKHISLKLAQRIMDVFSYVHLSRFQSKNAGFFQHRFESKWTNPTVNIKKTQPNIKKCNPTVGFLKIHQ